MTNRPPAFEKLYKILKLEADTGYRDKAMIGGLSQFATRWQQEAGEGEGVQRVAEILRSYSDLKPVDPRRVAINQIVQLMGYPAAIRPDPTAAAQPPIVPEALRQPDQAATAPSSDRAAVPPTAAVPPIEPEPAPIEQPPAETKPAPPPRPAPRRTPSRHPSRVMNKATHLACLRR